MRIGFVGLGKMGANMVQRLIAGGHEVVVHDRSQDAMTAAAGQGAEAADSLHALVQRLPERKAVWIMIPAGPPVLETVEALLELLGPNDILIDGGNSNWRETGKTAKRVHDRGLHFIDCGTSGGIWGLKEGYCLMVGGDEEPCRYLEPVFKTLAPENGYLRAGSSGAGHFVKMVHNGIEYGMMQAYAEGFDIMNNSPFDIDLRAVSDVWQHGSVVRSWLLELAARALKEDPDLSQLEPWVEDSGEGRWAVQAAIDFDTPAPVITHSLFARFQSRQKDSFAMRLLAALRNQFGGHAVKNK
ncbi:phosphogluconate dehydrogenase (NAD(+)-dependent, decarboxylating) [Nitrospina watsonii]|uniref:6-phosphogluconate dehydrogenase, NAD(+)-dependent, decarboxylating n=1 Tax=Nitrospina watsonii TaxID=1323948 RepID=A0ABN8VZ52_9BACT|nr:decarboxylating 6-phosphogluconate dehydrogenase [Nitrospina watsonii]CAI2717463.1 6-phosphogluconate dehydrogenase, NAD(+)-dependent, decarboxylating [Nitrospina watsonii]